MVKKKERLGLFLIASLSLIDILLVAFILIKLSSGSFPCANSISCIHDLSGNYDPKKTSGEFMGQKISVPPDLLDEISRGPLVLGIQDTPKDKKIYVNLTTQHLYAYEGGDLIYNFSISSGRFNPTPVGKFYIWIKLLATNMEGGDKADNTYYNFPNVPYTMFFYNENVSKASGYGIHGAYWAMPYGKPMSQGCVVLSVSDAGKLYRWAEPSFSGKATYADAQNPGTPVIIFGKAPL